MKYIVSGALLALTTFGALGQNYQYGNIDRNGNFWNYDSRGNYSYGTIDQNGNYWEHNIHLGNGNGALGGRWQDPD